MAINTGDRTAIANEFAALTSVVTLLFFQQSIGCDVCAPTRQMLHGLTELSDRVVLETLNLVLDKEKADRYGVDRVPAIIVSAPGTDRIRFYGAPFGNELMSLVTAIRMSGTGASGLGEQSQARLKALVKPVDVKVFFTPTCVYCPRMVALANQLAIESPYVTATAIDATEYPDLVGRYNVNGVPKTVINDTTEIMGAASEEDLVAAIC